MLMQRLVGIAVCLLFFGVCCDSVGAAFLPPQLVPPPPFPLVLSQWAQREFVAPGIERATYRLQTSAGPLVISVVDIDPNDPSVRFGTVLASDHIISAGETVSSMAARTGAVAGINADYFDIGNTNTPLGVLAQNGGLVRTPSNRAALTITRERAVRFDTYRFRGTAVVNGTREIKLTSINEWPPHDGASLLTPAFGVAASAPGTVSAELAPLAGSDPALGGPPAGRYRVTQIDDAATPHPQRGFVLGLGRAAQSRLTVLPDVGDLIDISFETEPPLADVWQAIGGGPALLTGGMPVDDPLSPGYAERGRRIPVAAVGRFRDGGVALVVVDGRRPLISIGVNRAELGALLAGLGASDALQFDSGGSATLVARVLGETAATLQNEPSDGIERPVADGLFVYSDAPLGPPARLVVRPSTIEALPATDIPLRAEIVDASGHTLGAALGAWHVEGGGARIGANDILHTASTPLTTTLELERDGVRAELPLEIVAAANKIVIAPERPNPDPGASVALRAQAFDLRGRPIDAGDRVSWSALRGRVSTSGMFTAGPTDGFVSASIGAVKSSEVVHVGRHRSALPGFDPASRTTWSFSSIPAGGPGGLAFTIQGTLQLSYDFSASERAAYANTGVVLGEPLELSCAIDGDGSGAGIRIALLDRYGERSALTLAKTIDWTGTQHRGVHVPVSLAPPIVLQSIYAVGTLGTAPIKAAGTIGIRNCEVTLPGTAARTP